MITITDQGANLFKDSFQRLRPCYDETVKDSIRLVKDNCGGKYGSLFSTCLEFFLSSYILWSSIQEQN